jgi:hypothetical protein
MKSKIVRIPAGDDQVSANEQVRYEMQSFLRAVNTYPDRFARDPKISFEKYCGSLMQSTKTEPRRGN